MQENLSNPSPVFGVWTLLDIQDADPSPRARKRVKFALGQMGIFTFLFPFARTPERAQGARRAGAGEEAPG